jgi:DNA polymerase III gamma/tau subunit
MPFQKGKSGNAKTVFTSANQPANRGRKTSDLEKHLSRVLERENASGVTVLEGILNKIAQQALGGNLKAAEMLLNYAYGKPRQSIDHTSMDNAITTIPVIVFTSEGEAGGI